ncbi:LOW QUALITY PROTEIN: hypothetical protein MAR_002348 [Mya arenaria]|uniref:Uncharacterized protein n=1 Tax=Mya arenaria TaxID=6604 RepID=A0ABY7FE99_MYAAR|nr:LOW QUALITY PROTEIN: hypothetical protein MAR_002348 [Mya arenaria]
MSDNGLDNMKGRTDIGHQERCSIIITPNEHHVTELIVCFYNMTHGHVGVHQVLAAILENPLNVKAGRFVAKKYWFILTCLTTRTVHHDVGHNLTTYSFVAAFRRFTNIRGYQRSDNAANVVSSDRELRISMTDRISIRNRAFNGATRTLTTEHLLNDEQLVTLMIEAEMIMNDRPITQVSKDSTDPPA